MIELNSKLLKNKFRASLLFSYISQGVIILAGFVQLYVINRFFGIEVFGQFSIIVATVGIFSSIVTSRSSEAVTRFLKREELNANWGNAKLTIIIGLVIDVATALLLLLLSYCFSSWFAELFLKNSALHLELFLYAFVVFFGFLKGTGMGFFQAKEQFITINIFNALGAIFNIIVLALVILFFEHSLKVLIFAFIISSSISCFFTLIILYYRFNKQFNQYPLVFNASLMKEYWHFNVKTFLSSSLKAGNQNIENLILGFFVNAESVGIYQTIKKTLSPIALAVQPLSMLIYPKMIELVEKKRFSELQHVICKLSLLVGIVALVFGVIVGSSLGFVFELIDVVYEAKYLNYFIIAFVTSLISSLFWWVRIFSNSVNPIYSLYLNLMATFFQLIITSILTYFFGLYGVLFALLLLQTILGCCWTYLGKRDVFKNI